MSVPLATSARPKVAQAFLQPPEKPEQKAYKPKAKKSPLVSASIYIIFNNDDGAVSKAPSVKVHKKRAKKLSDKEVDAITKLMQTLDVKK